MSRNYRLSHTRRRALLVARAVVALARPNVLLLGAGCLAGCLGTSFLFRPATAQAKPSAHARCGTAACLASHDRDKAEAKLKGVELERLAWRTEKGRYEQELRNMRRQLGTRAASARREAPLWKWLGRAERVLTELRDTNHELKQTAHSTMITAQRKPAAAPTALVHFRGEAGTAVETSAFPDREALRGAEHALPTAAGDPAMPPTTRSR